MKQLKALEILKFMKMSSSSNITILNEAIAELEALNNRSCENCKHDYVDVDDNCQRCNRYYEDKFEIKDK